MNLSRHLLVLVLLFAAELPAQADSIPLRVVAANLTSGRHPTYAPDTGTNAEGAGARILKALAPDVVLIQEFNTDIPIDQWVRETFGEEFHFFCEEDSDIPNGIISRHPIIESGEWKDPHMPNRDFAWAKIALPNGRTIWAISVHFSAKRSTTRVAEATTLMAYITENIPADALLVLGGDFNSPSHRSPEIELLAPRFPVAGPHPADAAGNPHTNAKRTKPYDLILPDHNLAAFGVPVKIADQTFRHGLIFDSRTFSPLAAVPPVLPSDSAGFQMQHMAVVRDFLIPDPAQK